MLDRLKNAIEKRQRLEIYYDPGTRIIEPHTLGFSGAHNELLRAFQVSGASASGEHKDWKLFRVDQIKAANDNGETFDQPRVGYKKGDKAMKGGIIREL